MYRTQANRRKKKKKEELFFRLKRTLATAASAARQHAAAKPPRTSTAFSRREGTGRKRFQTAQGYKASGPVGSAFHRARLAGQRCYPQPSRGNTETTRITQPGRRRPLELSGSDGCGKSPAEPRAHAPAALSLPSLPPGTRSVPDRAPQSRAVHLAELEVLGLERLLDVALPVPRLLLLRGGRRRGGGRDRRQPVQHLPDVKFPHGSRRRRSPLRWPRRSRRRRPPRRRQTSPRREGGGAGAAALLLSRPRGGRRAQTLVRQRGAAPHRGTEAGAKQIRARQPAAPTARPRPPASHGGGHGRRCHPSLRACACVCVCVCALSVRCVCRLPPAAVSFPSPRLGYPPPPRSCVCRQPVTGGMLPAAAPTTTTTAAAATAVLPLPPPPIPRSPPLPDNAEAQRPGEERRRQQLPT